MKYKITKKFTKKYKKSMGHIAHLSNFGPYRNIICIVFICPSSARDIIILPLFYVRKFSCKTLVIISPGRRINKLESPSPKDDLCQVWLELAQWFWGRFFNDLTPFLHFCDYLPFAEDLALYLNKT